MRKITLLSDTHGYMDNQIMHYCSDSDEIWHAGDFGSMAVSDALQAIRPLKGVYGNIDGQDIRIIHPLEQRFKCEETDVWMIHIGGYPGHYQPGVKEKISQNPPSLFICGHSHILKIQRDDKLGNMLCINPGAAGKYGFHKVRTMICFKVEGKRIFDLDVIELGKK